MTIYYLYLAWLVVWTFIGARKQDERLKRAQFICCLLPAIFIVALRGVTVGTDTVQYASAAIYMKQHGIEAFMQRSVFGGYEPGFVLLVGLCSLFPDPALLLIVTSAALCIGVPFWTIHRLCNQPTYGYLLFYLSTLFYFSMTAIRQAIAIAFIFLAYYFYLKQETKCALGSIFLASAFHLTALIALPALLLGKIRPSKKILIVSLFLMAGIGIGGSLLIVLFSAIPKYGGYLTHGQNYLESGGIMPYLQLVFFSSCLFGLVLSRKAPHDKKEQQITRNYAPVYACILGLVIAMSGFHINLFYRFMYCLLPIILIHAAQLDAPSFSVRIKDGRLPILLAFLILFAAFLFVPTTWFGIDPYSFYGQIPYTPWQ